MVGYRGVASIALLPSGSFSGHFVDTATRVCLGIMGKVVECERECSRGEDYRLVRLSIIHYQDGLEDTVVMVECHGRDAARFATASSAEGWGEAVSAQVALIESKQLAKGGRAEVKFECSRLEADERAEEFIAKFLPSLRGRDAVVNFGPMTISLPDPATVDVNQDQVAITNNNNDEGPKNDEGCIAIKVENGAKTHESCGGCESSGGGGGGGGGWSEGKDGFVVRGLGGFWGENGKLRGKGVEETLSVLVREELAAEGLIGDGEEELEGLGEDALNSEEIT